MNSAKIKDLQGLFIERGYNPVIGTIYQQQEYWLSWYRGEVDGFHAIQRKNAEGRLVEIKKPSLQMAKKVSEDVTSLLFNEKVTLKVNDDTAQEILDKVLDDTYFYDEMPNFIELTAVYGTGVAMEYIADDKVKISYIFGDRVFVIDYENTTIKAIAVVQEFIKQKMKYTHVMYHEIVEDKYRIRHEVYATKEGNKGIGDPTSLAVIFSEQELAEMRHEVNVDDNTVEVQYYVEYDTIIPHFQVFKFPISNNYDVRSPLGISLFANSDGTLESIDEKYYSSRVDSENSRKRLFVDDEATKLHKTVVEGVVEYKKYFDPAETQFQTLKGMNSEGNKAIEIYAPDYDSAQHDTAIQAELNYLSLKCMLGRNYYSFENGAVGYQNELNVSMSNSDTFRNRQKTLNRLNFVLVNMMKSILYLQQELGNYSGSLELEYEVQFDDDILEDNATKLARLRQDGEDGKIPNWMYVAEAYKLNEDDAKKLYAEAQEEKNANAMSFINDVEDNEDKEIEDDVDGKES